ncbi:hypothetical protein [Tissierella pigra]|uniref:Uncharacterized protein n=1 Tax=Tissierella pigra TaxID=2607614 RepID=A0A6N7XZB1_9FIRM|nr:hypothetical protein [Tissierella pigra]MSU01914.1 hypothetical protein [Tissierella pigra]
MGIDMTGYKMIYKDTVYNCLSIAIFWKENKITELDAFYLNEENRVATLRDDVNEFQFIHK